jgi:hypothetical protein
MANRLKVTFLLMDLTSCQSVHLVLCIIFEQSYPLGKISMDLPRVLTSYRK